MDITRRVVLTLMVLAGIILGTPISSDAIPQTCSVWTAIPSVSASFQYCDEDSTYGFWNEFALTINHHGDLADIDTQFNIKINGADHHKADQHFLIDEGSDSIDPYHGTHGTSPTIDCTVGYTYTPYMRARFDPFVSGKLQPKAYSPWVHAGTFTCSNSGL